VTSQQAAPIRSTIGCFFSAVLCASLAALLLTAAPAGAAEVPNHPQLFAFTGATSPAGDFEDACGVAVGSAGAVYVSDYYHHVIDLFNPLSAPPKLAEEDPLDGPCGLALDSGGDLYVNNFHRNVVRFTPSEFSTGPGTVIDAEHSTGVAVDPATGNVFVNDRTYIAEYEPSGAPVLSAGEPIRIGLGSLGDAYGVAVSDFAAAAGYVYVPDASGDTVKVYDPATDPLHPVRVIDGLGTPQAGFVSLLDAAIAIDQSSGHVYVVDNTQPRSEHPAAAVDEFNAAGAYRGQLPAAIVDGEPSGLAVNGGDVYVTSGNDEGASVLAFGPAAPSKALTVAMTGAGTGTVRSEPAGIDCGGACVAEFSTGAVVTLLATPDPGSVFAGFSGGGCSGTGPCHVTLGADTKITAAFDPLPPSPLAAQGAISASTGANGAVPAGADGAPRLKLAKLTVEGPAATFEATVSAPGVLAVSGAGLSPIAGTPVATGRAALRLRLNAAGRRALRGARHHRLGVRIAVTFTPSDPGPATVISRTLTFKTKSQEMR
jgi:Uncharacterized conserved protein